MQGANDLLSHLDSVLFDQSMLRTRIAEMGEKITQDFQGEPLLIVAILKGSALFMADLIREIHLPVEIDTLNAASYHGEMKSSGEVSLDREGLPDVKNRHVLVVDDILDTGRTLAAIKETLQSESDVKSIKTAVLLKKNIEREVEIEVDYFGFEIGSEFVVGYGLDYQGRYRNLPVVGVLKEEFV